MKKLVLFTGLLLPLLFACREEIEQQEPTPAVSGTITLTARLPESKTELGETSGTVTPVLWNQEDEIWVRSGAQETGTPGTRDSRGPYPLP